MKQSLIIRTLQRKNDSVFDGYAGCSEKAWP